MKAWLRNGQGCIFDQTEVDNAQNAIAWAKGRGGAYTLIVEEGIETIDFYSVDNDVVRYMMTLHAW